MNAGIILINLVLAVLVVAGVVTAMTLLPNREGALHPHELRQRSREVRPGEVRKAA